jgi:hypothetical protein
MRPHGASLCNTYNGGATRSPCCTPHAHRHEHRDDATYRKCNSIASGYGTQPPLRDPRTAPHTTSQIDPPNRCSNYITNHRYVRHRPLDACLVLYIPYPPTNMHTPMHTTSQHTQSTQHIPPINNGTPPVETPYPHTTQIPQHF